MQNLKQLSLDFNQLLEAIEKPLLKKHQISIIKFSKYLKEHNRNLDNSNLSQDNIKYIYIEEIFNSLNNILLTLIELNIKYLKIEGITFNDSFKELEKIKNAIAMNKDNALPILYSLNQNIKKAKNIKSIRTRIKKFAAATLILFGLTVNMANAQNLEVFNPNEKCGVWHEQKLKESRDKRFIEESGEEQIFFNDFTKKQIISILDNSSYYNCLELSEKYLLSYLLKLKENGKLLFTIEDIKKTYKDEEKFSYVGLAFKYFKLYSKITEEEFKDTIKYIFRFEDINKINIVITIFVLDGAINVDLLELVNRLTTRQANLLEKLDKNIAWASKSEDGVFRLHPANEDYIFFKSNIISLLKENPSVVRDYWDVIIPLIEKNEIDIVFEKLLKCKNREEYIEAMNFSDKYLSSKISKFDIFKNWIKSL